MPEEVKEEKKDDKKKGPLGKLKEQILVRSLFTLTMVFENNIVILLLPIYDIRSTIFRDVMAKISKLLRRIVVFA